MPGSMVGLYGRRGAKKQVSKSASMHKERLNVDSHISDTLWEIKYSYGQISSSGLMDNPGIPFRGGQAK